MTPTPSVAGAATRPKATSTEVQGPTKRLPRPLAGPVLVAISILHIAGTPLFHAPAVAAIIDHGLVNAVDSSGRLLDARASAFWYVVTGLVVALLGYMVWWIERIAVLPAAIGWLLVAFTALNVVLFPLSGFWLFLLPAAVALRRARQPSALAAAGRDVVLP